MGSNLPCKSGDGIFQHALHCTDQLTASPVAVDAESPLNPAELQVLRAQYEKEGDLVGVQTKFNYAWVSQATPPNTSDPLPLHHHHHHTLAHPVKASSQGLTLLSSQGLVKSNRRDDQQLGVMLLSEIFRTSPERRRECLFYLALGNFKLGNYAEARRYNDLLLQKEPANMQANDLSALIDDKVAKEGLMGVAIVSGLAVAAGVVGGVLFRNLGRKR